jgi:hypothetical protein
MDMFEFVIGDGRLLEEEADELYFVQKGITSGKLDYETTQLLLLAGDIVHSLASTGLLAEKLFSMNVPVDLENEIQSAIVEAKSAKKRFRAEQIDTKELRAEIRRAKVNLRDMRKKVARQKQ